MTTEQKPFEFVSHTADVAVAIRGRDLAELFRHAAAALYDLTVVGPPFAVTLCRIISVDSANVDCLLADWLNELIYVLYTEHVGFSEIRFDELGDGRLRARCCGESLVPGVHREQCEVKAATYHMVRVEQTRGCCTAQVIFDV